MRQVLITYKKNDREIKVQLIQNNTLLIYTFGKKDMTQNVKSIKRRCNNNQITQMIKWELSSSTIPV